MTVYVFLADGFEESEAITPSDILIRGGVQVKTVGVTGKTVTGAHGIAVTADIMPQEIDLSGEYALLLPGGMPGTRNLKNSDTVQFCIDKAVSDGRYICAICAAPAILGRKNLLCEHTAVCYPGLEEKLNCKKVYDGKCVKSGNFITAKGPGAAAEFGFLILETLKDSATALAIREQMCF